MVSYGIISQEATSGGLVFSCFQGLKRCMNYNETQSLTVETYPPHPNGPIDMFHIWKRVGNFGNDLRAARVKASLSIHLMGDEIAAWSTKVKPHETMRLMLWDEQSTNCDVGYGLDAFARLVNVTRSTIHPPIAATLFFLPASTCTTSWTPK